jgi:threonine aldolase
VLWFNHRIAALVAANHGAVASYGDDPITSRLEARFRKRKTM